LALALIVYASAWLRLHGSGDLSLRLDEGQSLHFATLPLQPFDGDYQHTPSLFEAAAADVHPPGYLLLLHWWAGHFGTEPATLRLPSELASIATIPVLYLLAARLYGRRVGLLAAGLAALSPFWIWHAQEARMYGFLVFFAVAATLGLVEALEHGRTRGWWLFTAATVLGAYFHYFALLVLAAHIAYTAVRLRRLDPQRLLPGLTALITIAALYLPWVYMLSAHYRGAGDPALAAPNVYTPLLLMSDFLLGYLNVAATSQVVAAWPLLVLLGLAAGAFGAHPTWRGVMLWTLLLVPAVLVFAASWLWRPMVSARYLIVVTPALLILVAVTMDRILRGRFKLIGLVVAGTLMLGGLQVERTSPYNPAAEDYRQIAAYIHQHARPGDLVGLDAPFNRYAYAYYADDNLPTYAIPPPGDGQGARVRLDQASIDRYVRSLAAGHQRLWMLYYLEDERSAAVRHYLDYHAKGRAVIFGGRYGRAEQSDPRSFVNVQLVLYELPNLPQLPVQARPLTLRQLDWLTGRGPRIRDLDPAPVAAEGQAAPPLGRAVPEARPLPRWGFAALAKAPPDDIITLFNPNRAPASVQVQAHWTLGDIVTEFQVPAMSNLEFSLSHWDSRTAGLAATVVASLPVTVSRNQPSPELPVNTYGYDAAKPAGQRWDGQVWVGGQQAPAPAQLVQLPCGGAELWASHLQAATGTFTVSRYLQAGQQHVMQGSWNYDRKVGGVQRVATIPAEALGYGNYELHLRREEGGAPSSERIAYFGIGCAPPWTAGPAWRSRGRGHDEGGDD
jgi:4-amino-4-deoxy-L-arabinose transferase-like glycosyltransferase